jgi:hypothetical protein
MNIVVRSLGWWKVFKLPMHGCLKIILKEVDSGSVYKEHERIKDGVDSIVSGKFERWC